MPNLIVGLGVMFALVGNAMAADISTYWIGSCSYLASNSTAASMCSSVGSSSAYCNSANSSLSGNSTYPYCNSSKWYDDNGVYSGEGIFCFKSINDCTTAMGLSGNTNSTTMTERNKGIKVSGSNGGYAMSSGYTKVVVTVLNTAFFECINTCSDWADWVVQNNTTYGIYETRQKQYCMSNGTCRPESSSSTCEVRCPVGYYDNKGYGTHTGLPPKVSCVRCPIPDGFPEEAITTDGAGVTYYNYEYKCVALTGIEFTNARGVYTYMTNCPYVGDGI